MTSSSPGRSSRTSRTGAAPRSQLWRAYLAGALTPLLAGMLLSALLGYLVPEKIQPLSIPMRLAESLAPHLLVAVAGLSLLLAAVGYWRLATVFWVATLASGIWLAADYGLRSGPRGQTVDLTVLWINLLFENKTPPEIIARRLADSGADVIVVAEPLPLAGMEPDLAQAFPYQAGKAECTPECGLLVLSRHPIGTEGSLDLGRHNPDGLFTFVLNPSGTPDHSVPVAIMAVHLLKPWYTAFTEGEREVLDGVLNYQSKPLLLVGDFNTAPWSRRIRRLTDRHDLETVWPPVATWPAQAGRWGIPLDQAMQRNGLRIVSATPWGADIGSNHRGLLVEVDLP